MATAAPEDVRTALVDAEHGGASDDSGGVRFHRSFRRMQCCIPVEDVDFTAGSRRVVVRRWPICCCHRMKTEASSVGWTRKITSISVSKPHIPWEVIGAAIFPLAAIAFGMYVALAPSPSTELPSPGLNVGVLLAAVFFPLCLLAILIILSARDHTGFIGLHGTNSPSLANVPLPIDAVDDAAVFLTAVCESVAAEAPAADAPEAEVPSE